MGGADHDQLTIAFGPVGVAGLVALLVALVRGKPLLGLVAVAAVVADATQPALGGFAAARARGRSGTG